MLLGWESNTSIWQKSAKLEGGNLSIHIQVWEIPGSVWNPDNLLSKIVDLGVLQRLAQESEIIYTISSLSLWLFSSYTHICRWKEYSLSMTSVDTISSTFKMFFSGPKDVGERHGRNLTRIATLEARASKSVSLSVLFFLPFMFFLFAFALGEFLLVTTPYRMSMHYPAVQIA